MAKHTVTTFLSEESIKMYWALKFLVNETERLSIFGALGLALNCSKPFHQL